MTLAELAGSVRRGERSVVDVVRTALERIDAFDRDLNAVVLTCPDAALEAAERLDARIANGGAAGVLAGLPFLVKDTEDAAGLPTTFGSRLYADAEPAPRDADDVARLRAADAIVVGKTNVPEFAFEGFTANDLFGATANPWSPGWSPGGSSGGSAVALATGMVPIATATDGGGSARIPAAFCGIVGLKPSHGLLGRDPIPSSIDMSVKGVLATTIEDAGALLEVLRGPAPGDPDAIPLWSPRRAPAPKRLLVAERLVDYGPLPPAVSAPFEDAIVAAAEAFGLAPQRIDPPFGPDVDEAWFRLVGVEELAWFGRDRFDRRAHDLTPYVRDGYTTASRVGLDEYVAARRARFGYIRVLDELLDSDVLLASPTMCVDGFRASDVVLTPNHAYNTQVANLTGHPAISLPAGRCDNGVPFGFQLMTSRFAEDVLLSVGAAWERALPWRTTAPGFEPFPGS